MSWSVGFIGNPSKVVEALEKHSDLITGQSKIEFDDALPHLVGLVKQNFAEEGENNAHVVIQLTANGHGYANGTVQMNRQVQVDLKRVYGLLV